MNPGFLYVMSPPIKLYSKTYNHTSLAQLFLSDRLNILLLVPVKSFKRVMYIRGLL